ncbi:stability/partitioning determinant [Yoonia sediminilitoris]|uniref:Stability/partitioning determinant n=1 Tax=Yoonia sediminilitoris TaxID=1286148 RepID=A0A2T6KF17_9RHOB|nr:stability/partitioning determinant [Yoonia sediminilitoris]PUB13724.1 hypothetical protein C8N45_107185 [Yoonia sediminilitoris]RCW94894.1 hypothetical protein DFP92_107185 [Yoonia sediminilitoris]
MTKSRLDLGFTTNETDLSGVKPEPARLDLPRDNIRDSAKTEGFDRDAKPKLRRRRTGRNVQINIKTRQETIDAFYMLADENGWGLGEAFEEAVSTLEANIRTNVS